MTMMIGRSTSVGDGNNNNNNNNCTNNCTNNCANCGFEMRELDYYVGADHPLRDRCCSLECMNHYFILWGRGWMVER